MYYWLYSEKISRRVQEAETEVAVEVGDKGADTLEGEALMHHPAMDSKFLFLKLPHVRESLEKMRLPLEKAIKHIPRRKNSEFLLFVFYS